MTNKEKEEARIQEYYELGQIIGLGEAVGFLLNKACDCFRLKQDNKAKIFRNIAEEINDISIKKRKDYDDKYYNKE